eukprot:512599_1
MQALARTPRDPYNLIFVICLVLGCGTLLAYNVLVSCATYFNYQFYNYPNVMFIIVPIYSIPNIIFTLLMIPLGDRFSWTVKILGCFTTLFILVLFIPFIVSSNNNVFHLTQSESYYIFLTIVALIGCINAILQCSTTGFCGLLPMKYLQTLMGGMAASGILVCIIRIGSKISIPLTPKGIETSGLIYFMISAIISIICAISFYYSKTNAFVQHHVFSNIHLSYARKLKRIHLSTSPSNKNVLHRDIKQHKKDDWSTSDDNIIDYHIDITSPIQRQINGLTPTNQLITYDTEMMFSSETGTESLKTKDVQTITVPILLRSDTPHRLASIISSDIIDSPPSLSFISDDDIIAPLKDSIQRNVKSYGSVENDSEELSSDYQKHIKEKQRRLFRWDSSKQDIVSLTDKSNKLPKYYVKHHKFNWIKYIHVFRIIKYLVLSIWLDMAITFLWFPGIVTNIPSSFDIINNDGEWMPIILITEFNIVDYIGRQFLSSYTPKWLTDKNLWIISLLRIVTYPVFVAFYRGDIVNDYVLHIIMILSALSNGYCASLSFMFYPRQITKHQHQSAASIMTLGLISGILSGSGVALILRPEIKISKF